MFTSSLTSHAEFRASIRGNLPVTATVDKDIPLEVERFLCSQLFSNDAFNQIVVLFDGSPRSRIQVERNIRLALNTFPQNHVPNGIHLSVYIVVMISESVFEAQFLDNSAFTRMPMTMSLSAAYGYANLTAGIAAKHRPVLYQYYPTPQSRRGNRGAYTRHAAADYDSAKFVSVFCL